MSKEKKEIKSKVYNFGEKTEEYHAKYGKKIPVWKSPKYEQSKIKAIELIEKGTYGLDEGDFWILMNATKGGKMMYTGLIISHNGCLKINDKLDGKMKFKPSSVETVKDDGEKVKVMKYVNDDQGVYEFGEISPKNCMNDYPYAMVLKRLMDRVILKNSKVGFFGIYSDSESEDFRSQDNEPPKPKTDHQKLGAAIEGEMEATLKKRNEASFERIKGEIQDCELIDSIKAVLDDNKKDINTLKKYMPALYSEVIALKDRQKEKLSG